MYKNFGLFIDGTWRARGGQGASEVVDPATGETLGTVPAVGRVDVEEAPWRRTPIS